MRASAGSSCGVNPLPATDARGRARAAEARTQRAKRSPSPAGTCGKAARRLQPNCLHRRLHFRAPVATLATVAACGLLFTLHTAGVGFAASASAACPGKVVLSKYHGVEHCACPAGTRCTGSACSVGHRANGEDYSHAVHGFAVGCDDCGCAEAQAAADFGDVRGQKFLWIMGSHHKTGSFLMERIWGHLKREADPPLKVTVKSFKAVTDAQWAKIGASDTDVVVTFHASGVGPALATTLGRPYRFVHLVRDPADQVVSAVLYELQRLSSPGGGKLHDAYIKVVRKAGTDENEALRAMAEFMKTDLEEAAAQYEAAAADHNALNIRFEDFAADFDEAVRRMFSFLGVPAHHMDEFVTLAGREDLKKKSSAWLNESSHVTVGKHDQRRAELKKLLLSDEGLAASFSELRRRLGYASRP